VLTELVALKDGPRDRTYREMKDEAWDRARQVLHYPGSYLGAPDRAAYEEQGGY
jgi:hypothetical protein